MATAKQQPKRILYHQFFCGEGNLGESDGFFSLESGKLEYVDGWDCNDAHWRGEYMTGLLSWAGVEIKKLPEKYLDEAVKIAEKQWGLDYGDDEDDDGKDQPATTELFFQEGSSDKVYIANLYQTPAGWGVFGEYGRRGGKIKKDEKTSGVSYEKAIDVYDKLIAEKIKKGYQHANAPAYKDEDEDEDY